MSIMAQALMKSGYTSEADIKRIARDEATDEWIAKQPVEKIRKHLHVSGGKLPAYVDRMRFLKVAKPYLKIWEREGLKLMHKEFGPAPGWRRENEMRALALQAVVETDPEILHNYARSTT